jgi:hypothetical protein
MEPQVGSVSHPGHISVGRINMAVGAVTAPSTGSSQIPTYVASIN